MILAESTTIEIHILIQILIAWRKLTQKTNLQSLSLR